MISIFDINKAVNDTLKKAIKDLFPYDVPWIAEELQEPIERPSCKVMIENSSNGKLNHFFQQKTMTIYFYFFAKNEMRSKAENQKVQNAIEQALLDGIFIQTMWFEVTEIHADNTDGVLCCSFDLEIIEELERPQQGEFMEELQTKFY